jgi:hypothetical protein
MNRIVVLFVLLVCLTVSMAQAQKIKLFRALVRLADDTQVTGILYTVTDSTLLLAPDTPPVIAQLRRAGSLPPLLTVSYADIRRITLWRKGHGWRGPVTGLVPGLVLGGLIALQGRQFAGGGVANAGPQLLIGLFSVNLLLAGTVAGTVGALVPRQRLNILQNRARFREVRAGLRRFSVRVQRPLADYDR